VIGFRKKLGETMIKVLASFTLVLMSGAAAAETPLERGKYLVDAVMACDGCHTPRPGGNFNMEKRFSGGSRSGMKNAYTVRGSISAPIARPGSAPGVRMISSDCCARASVHPASRSRHQMPFVFYQSSRRAISTPS
jgi:hypothetical protein